MSYILDALKKSEAERNRGVAPSLLAIRHVHLTSRAGMWALLVALAINACIGGFWLFWRSDAGALETRVVAAPQSSATSATIASDQRTEVPTPPAVSSVSPSQASDVAASPILSPPTPPPAEMETAGEAMPLTSEMELANLTISTHVYANDRAMRAVTINGRRRVEGDTISAGVRLKEITETGVILDVNGRNVPLEVLQDWR
jgi:general secretion pathway protein B